MPGTPPAATAPAPDGVIGEGEWHGALGPHDFRLLAVRVYRAGPPRSRAVQPCHRPFRPV